MAVTAEDLRLELDEPVETWTAHDATRATAIIGRCRTRVVAYFGPSAYAAAETAAATDVLELVDEVTLAYAARRFVNPEQALQRRSGSDSSASFADGSDSASGLTVSEKQALDAAAAPYRGGRGKAFTVPYANQP